ncbi:fimbrial protein [Serratia fonticola]
MNYIYNTGVVSISLLLGTMSFQAVAFTCLDINGNIFNNSSWGASYNSDIYINVTPKIEANQNVIIRLGDYIQCRNDSPSQWNDYLDYGTGSSFGVGLTSFKGVISRFDGQMFPFPTPQRVRSDEFRRGTQGYRRLSGVLYLTPISTASGVVMSSGQTIATIKMIKWAQHKNSQISNDVYFAWRFIAKNNVTIPVGGCDVNERNPSVQMGDYPIDTGERNVNLSVRCGKNQNLKFSLSGKVDSPTIFSNISSSNPASGLGVQLLRNGSPVPVNNSISIGVVGTSYYPLDLKVRYALNGNTIKAGNVQSVIGVNFVYN